MAARPVRQCGSAAGTQGVQSRHLGDDAVGEDDLLIETVEKLWFKYFLGSFENLVTHAFIVIFTCRHGSETETVLALDEFCTRIRSQDNDRIPEIDLSTKVIRYRSLFQYLEKEMHDVGMRLLDLVKQDDRVRLATNGL